MDYADNLVTEYQKNKDKKIFNEVVDRYKPLVASTVQQYEKSGLPKYLIEGEAELLLTKAINTFNPSKGHFSTHAQNYLQGINREVNDSSVFYIPQIRANKFGTYKDTYDAMEIKLKRPPTAEEMADELSWNIADVKKMERETKKKLIKGDEIEASLKDVFFDKEDYKQFIYRRLDDRHKKVMALVFGIDGNPILGSDRAIAERIGISQTMVRKLKDDIIQKMRDYE